MHSRICYEENVPLVDQVVDPNLSRALGCCEIILLTDHFDYIRPAATGGDAGVAADTEPRGISILTFFMKRASWHVAHGQHIA
jgi:hypothetical protein